MIGVLNEAEVHGDRQRVFSHVFRPQLGSGLIL